jgi:hypothetical protein
MRSVAVVSGEADRYFDPGKELFDEHRAAIRLE